VTGSYLRPQRLIEIMRKIRDVYFKHSQLIVDLPEV
jgi:hypothetical protein